MRVNVQRRKRRVLSVDIECRPLHWIAGDYVSKEPTVIAARFADEPKTTVRCWALGWDRRTTRARRGLPTTAVVMLTEFRTLYDAADIICGHFLRGYDLPVLNGAMIEHGFGPLADKWTHDTKLDLMKMEGLSKSQKNLAALLGVKAEKLDMDQSDWRSANRLESIGIKKAKERCISDVHQNIEMREALLKRGMLRPPRWWTSAGPTVSRYVP